MRCQNVFGNRQVAAEAELLEDDAQSQCLCFDRVFRGIGLAAQRDRARCRLEQADENFHERGFAGTVLAQQRVHTPGPHGKVHALECRHGTEGLGDVLDFKHGCVG